MVLSAACYKFQRLGQCHHRHSLLPHGDRPHGLGENQRGEERLGLPPSAKARNRALGGVLMAYQLDLFAILMGGATEEVAPAVSRVPKLPLHFYRCADCLCICTSPDPLSYRHQRGYMEAGGKCGACDGSLEYLGRTERDRLVKEHEGCPCD